MVDIYNKDGSSSILNEWDKLSDEVNWEEVPKYIKKYRDRFFKFYNRAKNKPPPKNLKSGEFVVIWMQSFLDLIRPEFRTDGWVEKTEVSDWINRLSQMILDMGLTPVVKGCPGAWRRVDISSIKNAMVFTDLTEHIKPFPSAIHDEQINYKLIAHAKFHVLSHTSATNMLVLANAPTITMGRSWFTGLDIFNEPKTWDTLLSNPMYINQKNRNKWINWWLSKQVPKEEVINKFMETHDKYTILTNK